MIRKASWHAGGRVAKVVTLSLPSSFSSTITGECFLDILAAASLKSHSSNWCFFLFFFFFFFLLFFIAICSCCFESGDDDDEDEDDIDDDDDCAAVVQCCKSTSKQVDNVSRSFFTGIMNKRARSPPFRPILSPMMRNSSVRRPSPNSSCSFPSLTAAVTFSSSFFIASSPSFSLVSGCSISVPCLPPTRASSINRRGRDGSRRSTDSTTPSSESALPISNRLCDGDDDEDEDEEPSLLALCSVLAMFCACRWYALASPVVISGSLSRSFVVQNSFAAAASPWPFFTPDPLFSPRAHPRRGSHAPDLAASSVPPRA
mmetsp:Transcript_44580/g.74382  ORF Transcript_44580/g.74382 Transcript_44580/m.74382 type:complete len:316 (-) Transcript_44580:202-1149(-)